MDIIFGLINHSLVPWLLALAIIILAVGVWLSLRRRVEAFHQQLQAIEAKLHSIPPSDFVQHYEEFNEYINKHKLFSHQWLAFKHSLILPNSEQEHIIYYTHRPRLYFNQNALIAPQLNLNLYQSVPNILVGIGLFFTFIGLIAALWFASAGVAAQDIVEAKAALSELLHAATFKFVTSVAGLFASIIFSWREKAYLYQLDSKLHAFCANLEDKLHFTTIEQLSKNQLDEAKRQTEQLSRFNSELAVSIANALEDEFSEKLFNAIQPLAGNIQSLQGQLTNINQEALQTMVEQFSRHLQGAAGQEMHSMATTLRELQQTFGQFSSQMQQASNKLQQGFNNGAQQLVEQLSTSIQQMQADTNQAMQQTTQPMQQLIDSIQFLQHNLNETSISLQRQLTNAAEYTATTITSAGDELSKQIQQIAHSLTFIRSELTENIKTSLPAIQSMLQQLQEVREGLKAADAGLRATMPALLKTTNHVDDLADAVISAGNAMTETGHAATKLWQQQQKHFEGLDKDLAKIFKELSIGLNNYQIEVENFTLQLDNNLNQAVQVLSGLIAELSDNIVQNQSRK
jgi:predicted  nucleic acid-binding Zn-ribbon protein